MRGDWLTDSGFVYSRLLVSQDRESIYVTFAEFNSSYVRYIRESPPVPNLSNPLDNKSTGTSFLKMNEYGPFDIGTDNHMSSLGLILLAFCIGACETSGIAFEDTEAQLAQYIQNISTALEKSEGDMPNWPTERVWFCYPSTVDVNSTCFYTYFSAFAGKFDTVYVLFSLSYGGMFHDMSWVRCGLQYEI